MKAFICYEHNFAQDGKKHVELKLIVENCALFQILRDKVELTLHVMSYFTKSGLLFKTLPIILPFLSKSL